MLIFLRQESTQKVPRIHKMWSCMLQYQLERDFCSTLHPCLETKLILIVAFYPVIISIQHTDWPFISVAGKNVQQFGTSGLSLPTSGRTMPKKGHTVLSGGGN